MFDFLKRRIEYAKMAAAINEINKLVQNFNSEYKNMSYADDINEYILIITYITRKGVLSKIEQYKWPWNTNIVIFSMSNTALTLLDAVTFLIDDLDNITEQFGLTEIVQGILKGGDVYREYERNIDIQLKRKIDKIFHFQ